MNVSRVLLHESSAIRMWAATNWSRKCKGKEEASFFRRPSSCCASSNKCQVRRGEGQERQMKCGDEWCRSGESRNWRDRWLQQLADDEQESASTGHPSCFSRVSSKGEAEESAEQAFSRRGVSARCVDLPPGDVFSAPHGVPPTASTGRCPLEESSLLLLLPSATTSKPRIKLLRPRSRRPHRSPSSLPYNTALSSCRLPWPLRASGSSRASKRSPTAFCPSSISLLREAPLPPSTSTVSAPTSGISRTMAPPSWSVTVSGQSSGAGGAT